MGAAEEMLPLEHIAARLLALAQQPMVGAKRVAS
jgi:two-component system, chemotaxis family, protein-glutamate methylesterase/glutaminase